MCQYGNGFKNTGQRGHQPGEKRLMGILLMKPRLRLAPDAYGFGLQLSQNTGKFLGIDVSFERAMLVAERFIASLINRHGKHPVSTDGGTWYPQACRFLKLKHHLHSPFEKSLKTFQLFSKGECKWCFSFRNLHACGYHVPPSVETGCFPYLFIRDAINRSATSIALSKDTSILKNFPVFWFNCNPKPYASGSQP